MRIINKIFCVSLAALMLALSGCGKEEGSSSKTESKTESSSVGVKKSDAEESSLKEQSNAGEYLTRLAEKLNQSE